jgi:hypothetical protein
MAKRSGIRNDGEIAVVFTKSVTRNADGIISGRDGIELESAVVVGAGFAFPVGTFCL